MLIVVGSIWEVHVEIEAVSAAAQVPPRALLDFDAEETFGVVVARGVQDGFDRLSSDGYSSAWWPVPGAIWLQGKRDGETYADGSVVREPTVESVAVGC